MILLIGEKMKMMTKIKEYDGNNINELRFFEGLFISRTLRTSPYNAGSILFNFVVISLDLCYF